MLKKRFSAGAVVMLTAYCVTAFILWDGNPVNWGAGTRAVFIGVGGWVALMVACYPWLDEVI